MAQRIQLELIRFECVEVRGKPASAAAVSHRYSSVVLDGSSEHLPALRDLAHGSPSPALAPRPAPATIDALIHEVAEEFGHDPDLLRAIVRVESGFNVRAVSPKGAMGLMQLMPATARRFGLTEPTSSLFTPKLNLQIGARYFAYLRRLFPHDLKLAVAAYNAGEGAVMKRNNTIPPFRETQDYVKRVLSEYRSLREQRMISAKR